MAYNSDHFDLSAWKLTLPVDSTGGTTSLALDVFNLYQYESPYFFDGNDGAMVFRAMVEGATTSGTHYARTELREVTGGNLAAWNLQTGGTMTATVKVDIAPTLFDGSSGKFVIGQIHGKNDELTRLYWEGNKVYFKNDQSGTTDSEHSFALKNAAGQEADISIGEKFSYMIDAHGDRLTVKVFADGQEYSSVTTINDVWQSDTLYFKAGIYLNTNETQGTGVGQVSFYGLDYGHTPGSGLGGLTDSNWTATPADPLPTGTDASEYIIGTSDQNTIHGLNGNDTITGRDGNDKLYGDAGNDNLNGGWDDDMLDGGIGDDVLNGSQGNDSLYGGAGNDRATGGAGHDVFYALKGDNGLVIEDFTLTGTDSDTFVAKGFTATELAAAVLTQSGTNAVLTFGDGTQITFNNVDKAGLTLTNLLADIGGTVGGLFAPIVIPVTPPPAGTQIGTAANDIINTPSKGDAVVMAGAGDDKVTSHDGNDKLYGEGGNDILLSYWGNDQLWGGDGNDKLDGATGDDTLVGGAGNDTVTGGAGHDTFVVNKGDEGMTVTDFAATGTSSDTLVVHGYSSAELATATLTQLSGKVVLGLSDGAQVTFNSVTLSQLTSTNLLGDDGTVVKGLFSAPVTPPTTPTAPVIVATQTGTSGADTINTPSKGDATVLAGAGDDKVTSHDGNDKLYGQDGNDTIYGYYANDTLSGGNGADKLYGGAGDDILYGDAGNDLLYGEGGNDILNGGAGQDKLYGGAGKDIFVLSDIALHDVLEDFDPLNDMIDIRAIAATGTAHIESAGGVSGLYLDTTLVATFEGTSHLPTDLDALLLKA